MTNLAIIPARGGSKRIPRKNIRPFLGKPIIAYSIEAALQTMLFEEVMVSTDDEEICKIAERYGASVPFLRSKETSNDYATLADVVTEVVKCYEERGMCFRNICCILPTAPLISFENIITAYEMLNNSSKYNSVYPVVAFSYPVLRSLKVDKTGGLSMHWPEYTNTRSQDIEPFYHDTGTFYWHRSSIFRGEECARARGIVVDDIAVQDIDTETDWKLAELKYKLLHNIL
ncbi:MAG: pseudaminic acid cytidylyltransferase [Bacteroidales bacterium]|jgi:N-acylneuraminate cytidylyltransferase|nr:pseudaminic acid cytidylyltransferase [Bacteroidales bacterium]